MYMTNGELSRRVGELNQQSVDHLKERAQQERAKTIKLAYDAVEVHLEADAAEEARLEAEGYPADRTHRRFVTEDILSAPFLENEEQLGRGQDPHDARVSYEPQPTFSLLLLPRVLGETAARMRVHVPVPPDVTLADYEMPPLDEVGAVYFEYQQPDASPRRVAVGRDFVYEYSTPADANEGGDEAGEMGVFGSTSSAEIHERARRLADHSILTVTAIQLDMTERQVVPQRIGQGNDFIDV